MTNAPFRHNPWSVFTQLTLFALSANCLSAANPAITLQVSSETAPPGGYVQFKISLASPALVSTASVSMTFDPAIFGNIANVARFSATGDQVGYASVKGRQVTANFSSASAGLGQLPGLPLFVVTIPVLAAATSSITIDPTGSLWQDHQRSALAAGRDYRDPVNSIFSLVPIRRP
jgi:hypothetical protein